MREIKFRAWDKEDEVMIDWFWLSSEGDLYEKPVTVYDTPHLELERNDDLIAMQYTGLKDKNDKEIYEGDIVKTVYKTGCVEYCEKQARYNIYLKSKDRLNEMNFMKNMANECEVIGNVYEDSDLIK